MRSDRDWHLFFWKQTIRIVQFVYKPKHQEKKENCYFYPKNWIEYNNQSN